MKLIIYLLQFCFAILMIFIFPIYFATSAEIVADDSAQIEVISINFTAEKNLHVTDRSEQ